MEPIEFAEALNRGEKFLDPESGEIISIYGGADITGDVVGYTDDGRMIKANAKNLELAQTQIKDTKSDTEKLSEILDDMGIDNLENIVEAIKKGDEEYLIKHKQELIENIGNIKIRLSQLPERLRGDIDVMTAAIVNDGVYEMQDLAFVYSQATEELKSNPKFQMIVKHFETFFKEEKRKIYSDKEKANSEPLNRYHKAVKQKKSEYTKYYHESYVEDEQIIEAIQNGDEDYLLSNKDKLLKCIGSFKVRISQLPERLRGDIDVMTAAIVNDGVYEMQDLAFVYSQATEELRVNPEFQGVVKEFETFFKEQSKKLDQDRKTANVQAIQKSNERIKVEKTRYTEWLKMYDKASEMLKKGEISFDEWEEMTNDEWKEMTNPISTKQIGQVTKNAPTTTKIRVQEVENTEKENTNEIKGEEGRDDN